ncbi:MAG TPA: hypothetical protein VMT67_13755 [Terriglobales bacterium]|nr:hypothetical protein [Terriglobales bacterium]
MNKQEKLEQRRIEALSEIVGSRLEVERMAQRPRRPDDSLNVALFQAVAKKLSEIEESAKKATNVNDLNDFIEDAEAQEQFSAYLCPASEVQDEGNLTFDLIEVWGVPKSETKKLRDNLARKLESKDADEARSALFQLFGEESEWDDYIDGYEERMNGLAWKLFAAIIALPLAAAFAIHFTYRFSPLLFFGLFCASVAGACASIMAKMPPLDLSLSGELSAYRRRIFSRIGVGVVASLIGCALLAWGFFPISIQGQTFADDLKATSTTTCTGVTTLVLIGIPMLFGFSERTLTSFEQRVFGNSARLRRQNGGSI